jgi:RNA polymerase sigma-70 factor (family 1)
MLNELLSDDELLCQLKLGKKSALNEIYKRYFALLYAHAYRKLANKEEVRDILQDLFMYLWNNREELSIHTSLSSYLYTSIRNRVLNYFRNTKVRDQFVESLQKKSANSESLVEQRFHEKELIKIVEKEISQLPAQTRLIFEMSRNLEMSHREIASELNISHFTVRTQVRNALRILRVKLGTYIFSIFF